MSEKPTGKNGQDIKNRNVVFFLLLLLIVVSFLLASIGVMILSFYSGDILSKIALITGFLFVGFVVLIIVQAFIKKQIISQSKFPICHDMFEEFNVCARCKGFYVGFALFGVMLAIRTTVYMDFLRTIGPYAYLVIMLLVLVSVPIHGSLRRLEVIEGRTLVLHVVGFIFGSSLYLVGNYIVYLLYGLS